MLYKNVNCWFCDKDTSIIFYKINSWSCPHCEQYNGFKKDGDYNKDINEIHVNKSNVSTCKSTASHKSTNCLCQRCNFYQQLKIEKLSKFEPKNEDTYDLEIKHYKEYLEKIYTLCSNCQSKVKFEITKQDGILKQYMLNLGMFHNFFERRRSNVNPTVAKNNNTTCQANSNAIYILFRSFILAIMLILITLTIIYNGVDNQRPKLINHQQSNDQAFHIKFTLYCQNQICKEKYLYFSNMNLNYVIEYFRDQIYCLFKNQNKFMTREGLLIYFNHKIAMFLVAVWALCCLLVITSPKSPRQTNNYIVWTIAFIDLAFININYKQFGKYFRSTQTNEFGDEMAFEFCYIFAPIIQLAILVETVILFKMKTKSVKSESKRAEFLEPLSKPGHAESPFSPQTSSLNPEPSQIKFNYSFLNPNSYSLMKFINNHNESTFTDNRYNRSTTSAFTSSIIKPSKLANSVFSNQRTIKQESEMNWRPRQDSIENMSNRSFASDDSDEGSITSGLTNLYLGRADKLTTIKYEIPQSMASFREETTIRTVCKQEPSVIQRPDEDQYSFYQTETHRSPNHFFNARNSASCYQNYNNDNGNSINNSLKILKLFQ